MSGIVFLVVASALWLSVAAYGAWQGRRDEQRTAWMRQFFRGVRASILAGDDPQTFEAHVLAEITSWGVRADDVEGVRRTFRAYVAAVRLRGERQAADCVHRMIRDVQELTGAEITG